MRQRLVMGNWKLNGTKETVVSLIKTFAAEANKYPKVEAAICAPALFIGLVEENAKGSRVAWGSEDVDVNNQGAFTGEISAKMLLEAGVEYVIIGHSERRQYFGETDETVNKRTKAALAAGLKPIVCVGELLWERECDITEEVIARQIKLDLFDVTEEEVLNTIIAYEPVWAIGTGKTATADQAEEVCGFIRATLAKLYSQDVADAVTIQYGGSMNDGNADELLSKKDVDGGLIGGASLVAEKFAAIVKAASK